MKFKVNKDISYWKKAKDVDKAPREDIKAGAVIEINKEHLERLKKHGELVEEKTKEKVED